MSDKPATRDGGKSRLAPSSWPLRRKVALALAVPLVLAATLGGLRVAGDLNEAAGSSAGARQVTVLRPAVDYLTAGSRAMVAAQTDTPSSAAELSAALEDLEAAAAEMARTRSSADLTAAQGRQVDVILDLSRALREQSDTLSPGTWVAQLRQLQTGVARLVTTIDGAQAQPEPRLQQLSQALAARFSLALQQALVATERTGATGSLELFAELGAEGAAIDRLAGDLGQAEPVVLQLLIDNAVRTRTVRTGGSDLGDQAAYAPYDRLIGSLLDGIDAELAGSAGAARYRALVNGAVTLAALVAAIALALLVSRLLLQPIRRVREGALAVAHVSLPDAVARIRAGDDPGPITPIDVNTQEEVGQLARAVDDLHQQAVTLAAGEAGLRALVSEMFVTLSRRNTALVNQQLGLIDSLEKDEEDPQRLESLFRLDHLASRMRRTGDSLLILADAPSTAAQDGLTVGEAMQAATAGVQDYRRVQVGADSQLRITAEAAADVVHLLTELVDNSLTYSAPTTTVLVEATVTDAGVVIDIADTGLGIPADELETINERLRAGGEVTADTARRMGLFVVSRLARRHGVTVELERNERGGTTAAVLLPVDIVPELLPSPAEPPADAPADPSRRTPAETRVPETAKAAVETLSSEPAPAEPDPSEPAPSQPVPVAPVRSLATAPERRQPVAAPVAREESPAAPPVANLINAVLGLPSRVPGASLPRPAEVTGPLDLRPRPTAVDPVVPPGTEHRPEVLEAPENGEAPEAPETVDVAATVDVADVPELPAAPEHPEVRELPVVDRVDRVDRVDEVDEVDVVDDVAAIADIADLAEIVELAEAAAPAPAPTTQAAAPAATATASVAAPVALLDPLAGPLDLVPGAVTGADDDTPIFRLMRSAWLSGGGAAQPWTSSEVEAGWDVAARATAAPAAPALTPAGLPMRRPGASLVPGGVTKPTTTVHRDPEAVRARLAAHAAGVSRGRNAVPRVDQTLPEADLS